VAFSRYEEREIFKNRQKLYNELFDERGVNFVRQFSTPIFEYPTPAEFSQLNIETVPWSRGQRFWKIAETEYGNPELWWVIAWFNKKPTEAGIRLGDLILVPKPLDRVFNLLGL
jgi:hypothetical protein